MPALTMRGRYLMREYWSDSTLFLNLSAAERECYIGLWMLADDEGWMPRDVAAIAKALGGFEDREPREARVRATLEHLRELKKVLSYRCCLFVPAVARYPRPGKRTDEHLREHKKHSKRTNDIQRDSNTTLPDPTVPVLTSSNVAGERGREPRRTRGGPMSSLDEAMAVTPFGQAHAARKSA